MPSSPAPAAGQHGMSCGHFPHRRVGEDCLASPTSTPWCTSRDEVSKVDFAFQGGRRAPAKNHVFQGRPKRLEKD
jgi:hypothetical protein